MKAFRRFLFLFLACLLAAGGSFAEELDLSGYTLEDLRVLQDRIEQRIHELETRDAREVTSVSSITLDQTSLELVLGAGESLRSAKLSARISPEDASYQDLIWASSNEEVVTVDQEGNLRAVQAGRATVTVQTNDPSLKQQKRAACSVIVLQAVTEVQLSEDTIQLGTRKTLRLSAAVLPGTATKKNVEWKSSNPEVASVTTYGAVTGNQPGECVITCSAADGYGASASCHITVLRQITKITDAGENRQTLGIRIGGEGSVSVRIEPQDATNQQLQWTISDDSVASILKEEDGTVTLRGEAPGNATLTGEATDGSGRAIQYHITVEDECSVRCTGKVETGVSYGYKWFELEFENTSVSRIVDGITIRYSAEDVYGERLKSYGLGDEEVETTFNLSIAPGKTRISPQEIIYGFNQAKTISAAIVKLHYTNGEIIEVPDPEYLRFELAE